MSRCSEEASAEFCLRKRSYNIQFRDNWKIFDMNWIAGDVRELFLIFLGMIMVSLSGRILFLETLDKVVRNEVYYYLLNISTHI